MTRPASLLTGLRWPLLLLLPLVVACAAHPDDSKRRTLRIYLARHGQTDWNLAHRLQGGTDIPLNSTGRQQAEMLKERMAGVTLDQVYSSALQRSRETAEIARRSAPLESLPALNEQSLGRFEGALLDGSQPEAAADYDRRSKDPDDSLDGGESANQHFNRVRAAIDEIRRQHPSGAILIVGHGGTNQKILRALLGLTHEQAEEIHQANDELYLIEIAGDSPPILWKQIPPDKLADL